MCPRPARQPRQHQEPQQQPEQTEEADPHRYTVHPNGTVDYTEMFRNDLYACTSALELMEDVLFPEAGPAVLPQSWHTVLERALGLVDLTEEPLSTGDVCCHYHCQSLVHHLAVFMGECGEAVHVAFPASGGATVTSAETRRNAVYSFCNALLAVFAFAEHYLDAEQCADREFPQMVSALRAAAGNNVSTFPGELSAALRVHGGHGGHIWLHTFGEVEVAPLERDEI
jgi:hypothetical protein